MKVCTHVQFGFPLAFWLVVSARSPSNSCPSSLVLCDRGCTVLLSCSCLVIEAAVFPMGEGLCIFCFILCEILENPRGERFHEGRSC